jgi:predicted Zn-dependent peptidase
MHRTSRLPALLFLAPLLAGAQTLQEFEKHVTEFTLRNGMHFIVLERHGAPVVSFNLYVNAGSVNDPGGKSGLAHMFEHMIGKGTTTVGTTNWPEEKKALERVEQAYDRLDDERYKGPRADPAKVKALESELGKAIELANSFVEPNAYPRLIEENGAPDFNASTGTDATQYFYSLPSNKVELWFLLQSEWVRRPVFREFYKERDVVMEERRMSVESSPQGKLQEMVLATAFTAHPYRTLIGWASDIQNLRAEDAEKFWTTYYVPGNITVAIAGDVTSAEIRKLAEKYYGPIAAAPMPPPVITVEPRQEGEKRVTVESPAQPVLWLVYKRPSQRDKDDAVIDVIQEVLSGGRTGSMYRDMVRDKQIALYAAAAATFPSGKYPNLFALVCAPSAGHTVEENEKEIGALLDKLKNEKVDEATLRRVKTKVRASLIRQLDDNRGLTFQLAFYHVNYGSWKKLFTGLEDIDKVSADDVQRVARSIFILEGRTVGMTAAAPAPATAPAAGKGESR